MAVLAVVGYHAHISALPGGFVGVDVFFVISGFLITDLLWREVSGSGQLSFAGFYARRARRLLPAAMLVLVVTMLGALAWMPPLELHSIWKDGVATALYVGNYRFAITQTDYLASTAPSPFQHYWSLGVEEQFYVLWPLLLAVASFVWWRRRPSRGSAVAALAALSVGSLVLSIWLTHANQPWAFFSLPTRAWELGLGGLIALGAPALKRVPSPVAAAVGWIGLGAIVTSILVLTSKTPYPGTAALLPVLGSGAVIASGVAGPPAGPVLALGGTAMRAIGRISYSWYLWHWPVLILAPYAVGHAISEWSYVGLAVASGLLAAVTYRYVEVPARSSPWLSAKPGRSLVTGAALSTAGVVVCLYAAGAIPSVAGHGIAPVATINRSVAVPGPGSIVAAGAPTTTVDPTVAAFDSAQAQVEAAVAATAGDRAVPVNLVPNLGYAHASLAPPFEDGCFQSFQSTTQPTCLFGDTTGTSSIVLFGDSHAAQWFPAVDAYANAHGERLYVWTKAVCPPVNISIFEPLLGRTYTECEQWRAGVMASIASLHPALVMLGIAPNYDSAYDVVQDGPPWLAGLSSVVSAIRADGSKVIVMGSLPSPPGDIPDCLSLNLSSATVCDFPVGGQPAAPGAGQVGINLVGQEAEIATVAAAGGRFVNTNPWFCTATTCLAMVDNLLIYRDNSHLTVPYATYLTPLVEDQITEALSS